MEGTPQVKWSNAWWGMVLGGMVFPALLLGWLIYCIATDRGYAMGYWRLGKVQFVEVFGKQAYLMWLAYFGAAVASFAYGYARYHPRWGFYYDKMLALGMLGMAVGVSWCSLLFLFP